MAIQTTADVLATRRPATADEQAYLYRAELANLLRSRRVLDRERAEGGSLVGAFERDIAATERRLDALRSGWRDDDDALAEAAEFISR